MDYIIWMTSVEIANMSKFLQQDFTHGLKAMWEKYYKDRCSFKEIVLNFTNIGGVELL